MPRLIKQYDIAAETFVDLISTNPIVVYEDVQGSPIYVNWDGDKINIKPRKMSNDPLNIIDLAIQKYYGPAVKYFNLLSENAKSLMPKNWWFEFEYFFDVYPAHVKYDTLPKNSLILTGIVKGKKRVWNIQEIEEYSNLFEVDSIPIIFNGKLNDKQLEVIKYYLNTSEEDLPFVFGDSNFMHFFYTILNPTIQSSALMKHGTFQDNAEKIIIKIPSKKKDINIAILNPLYRQYSEHDTEKTEFVDNYTVILLNFLEYCQLVDLKDLELRTGRRSELYLEIMSFLFNHWMENTVNSFNNFEFAIPKFYKEDKYRVNLTNIEDPVTKKFIENDEKKEYAFRSVLGSFQKPRKKTVGIFNKTSLNLFNDMVHKINDRIEDELKLKRDKVLRNAELLNFGDFADVQYAEDAGGEVYPDLHTKAEEFGGSKKKKGASPIVKKAVK